MKSTWSTKEDLNCSSKSICTRHARDLTIWSQRHWLPQTQSITSRRSSRHRRTTWNTSMTICSASSRGRRSRSLRRHATCWRESKLEICTSALVKQWSWKITDKELSLLILQTAKMLRFQQMLKDNSNLRTSSSIHSNWIGEMVMSTHSTTCTSLSTRTHQYFASYPDMRLVNTVQCRTSIIGFASSLETQVRQASLRTHLKSTRRNMVDSCTPWRRGLINITFAKSIRRDLSTTQPISHKGNWVCRT